MDEGGAGCYFEWTAAWWRLKQTAPKSILWLEYESVSSNPHAAVQSIADFLQVKLDERAVDAIVQRASFNTMKLDHEKRPSPIHRSSPHFRSGKVGNWRETFSAAQSARLDKKAQKNFQKIHPQHNYG